MAREVALAVRAHPQAKLVILLRWQIDDGPAHAGLVDELSIAVAPLFLGQGLRLFDGIDARKVVLDVVDVVHSPAVTHLRYAVKRR